MGSYYALYTEIKVKDKWICINGRVPVMDTDELRLSCTYSSGSRSYFHETADKLESLGYRIPFNELSAEVTGVFSKTIHEHPEYFNATATGWKDILGVFPTGEKMKENHGYVAKNTVFAYETGEVDDIYDYMSVDEYTKLGEEEKKSYQYYEWNDEMGWYKYFIEIVEHVRWQIHDWHEINWRSEIEETRIICVTS